MRYESGSKHMAMLTSLLRFLIVQIAKFKVGLFMCEVAADFLKSEDLKRKMHLSV
jgi:hypothetical protein